MEKVERFYKELLKQRLSLPDTVADSATYILTGSIQIEGVIHSRALNLFGSVCRLSEDSVEKQVARRQLADNGDKSNSWFIGIKDILLKYDLPVSWFLLDTQPTKFRWKNQVMKKVNKYWSDVLNSGASLYPSLEYPNNAVYKPGLRHPVIQEPNGVKDVPFIHTKIKMLTGSYRLQVNRASFSQNQISPVCLFCQKEDETLEHFSLHCKSLENIRKPILDDICEGLDVSVAPNNSSHMLQCILEATVTFPGADISESKLLERHARRLCHALHTERFKRLPHTVTERKRTNGKVRNAN